MRTSRIALVAVAAAGLLLAGCSSTGGSGSDGGKITLRFGSPDTGPGAEFLQTVVDRYNESQDEVEVKLENYGAAFDQKITAQLGAGNAPDIMKMWNFPQYYKALVPLDDLIDGMADKDDFYPALFNYARMGGKTYGFPTGFSTRAVYYNKELAQRAGLTAPEKWSDADYAEWVTKIGELGGGVYGGNQFTNPDAYSVESLLFNGGGEWLDDEGKPVVNSDANKKVLTFYRDLAYDDATAAYVRKVSSSEDSSKVFIANQLGTLEFGKWYTDAFNTEGVSYGILPNFTFDGGEPKSVIHAAFLSINKDSKNADAAEDFITWYASPENVKEAAKYDLPIRESVADELGLTTDPIAKPFFDVLAASQDVTSSMLKSENWPTISAEIGKTLEKIFSSKDADIPAELDALQAKLESES